MKTITANPTNRHAHRARLAEVATTLRGYFSVDFGIWCGESSELLLRPPHSPLGDELALSAVISTVAARKTAQIVAEFGGLGFLAIPIPVDDETTWVATAPFVIGTVNAKQVGDSAAWDLPSAQVGAWMTLQTTWQSELLCKLATAVMGQLAAEAHARKLANEVELVSENLASTYEEISLLYSVTQNLRISSTDEELGRLAIQWLGECVPATAFAIHYLPVTSDDDATIKPRTQPLWITSGACPVDEAEFERLIQTLALGPTVGPYVANRRVTQMSTWQFPTVHEIIVVPLVESDNVFGWIAAFNHQNGGTFGSVESNLLSSLGTLLGIHCGHRELYRQQSELLQSIVRALVSAIDAKDPYTSGHSDRVARFAVRIALEMRCNPKLVNTIYMAGLLHDVGKIGIDDNVLRKAGRLTDLEFEHIKKHPELGHKILADIKQLADVLPAVLYHHEQWNGNGYPHSLAGEKIPKIARIMAVADSYDAMTSDRPYRTGMHDDKVDQIFRDGSGKYWDPEIVEAFFRAKDDIREIADRERAQVDAFQQQLV